ncbi:MAG: YbaB/EbfC family nucleoid-associated protein [Candidatus Komeilibacteria bacterium]
MSLLNKLGDLKDLKQKAQSLQGALAQERISSENKLVVLTINGQQEIIDLQLKEGWDSDKEATTQAIKEAWSNTSQQVQKMMANKMSGLL